MESRKYWHSESNAKKDQIIKIDNFTFKISDGIVYFRKKVPIPAFYIGKPPMKTEWVRCEMSAQKLKELHRLWRSRAIEVLREINATLPKSIVKC